MCTWPFGRVAAGRVRGQDTPFFAAFSSFILIGLMTALFVDQKGHFYGFGRPRSRPVHLKFVQDFESLLK